MDNSKPIETVMHIHMQSGETLKMEPFHHKGKPAIGDGIREMMFILEADPDYINFVEAVVIQEGEMIARQEIYIPHETKIGDTLRFPMDYGYRI